MSQDDDLENDVDSTDAAGDLASNTMPPTMSSSMKMPRPIDPRIKDYFDNKQKLADAQDQASRNEMLTGLARAGTSLSAGLAHSNAPINDAPFQAMDKTDQAPVQNVLNAQKSQSTELQNQKDLMSNMKQAGDEDPNSPQSLAFKAQIKRLHPGKYDGDTLDALSKADIGDSILKPLELDEKIQSHKDEMKNRAADRASAAADRNAAKSTADQNKALNYVTSQLDSARGDAAVKQAQVDLYSTRKINSLIGMYGDPNQLSQQQVSLLADEVAKVAIGGIPGEAGTEGITPNTLRGKMSTVVQNLTNSPTPANAAEFVKQYKLYSDAVAGDARSTIKSKLDAVIETHKNQMGDENYQNVKKQYYNRYGLGDDSAASAGSGDHASRAAAILAQRRASQASAPNIPLPNYAQGQPSPMLPQSQPGNVAQDGFAFGGTVQPPGFQHVRQPIMVHAPPPKPMHAPPMPKQVMPAVDQAMTAPAHFEQGGTVPGQPKLPFNSPVNDTVNAKLTPKEEVLPLSVTQSHAPAMAAYLHMKSKGYK